jgi:hypothetical protein
MRKEPKKERKRNEVRLVEKFCTRQLDHPVPISFSTGSLVGTKLTICSALNPFSVVLSLRPQKSVVFLSRNNFD